MTTVPSAVAVWHDVECGAYSADLDLWRGLAAAAGGPVLDVGAGTGRVSLDLARAGYDVTALDLEPELLAVLAERAAAAGLRIASVAADARDFDLGDRRFALIMVPMQTIQLLPEREGFLTAARRHLAPGGLVALAITEALEDFGDVEGELPPPDVVTVGDWRYASQPTAVRALSGVTRIERRRRTFAPDGRCVSDEQDVIDLVQLTVEQLEAEGRAAALEPEPALHVPPTEEHVGSEVVLLRG